MIGNDQPLEFAKIFIFLLAGFAIVYLLLFLARLLAPDKPTPEKLTSYECGEEPTGSAWFQVNTRFYVIALIFLLFDVEMIFIFPWSTVFAQKELIDADPRWGWLTFIEMLAFIGILMLGLVYLWVKGDLDWIKPAPQRPSVDTAIPLSAYAPINKEVHRPKPFNAAAVPEPEAVQAPAQAVPPKPAFKPVFRKPAP